MARKKTSMQIPKALCAAQVLFVASLALAVDETASGKEGAAAAPVFSIRKIWDAARHNAFTDLAFFKGQWYCAFREGLGHVCDEGKLRVIRSLDGEQWESVALMAWTPGMPVFFNTLESPDEWTQEMLEAGGDVRDAKLSIAADGRLMLNGAVRFLQPMGDNRHQSVTWLSVDGEIWDGPYACVSGLGTWRWSATWHKGTGYSFGYSGKDKAGTLYETRDGKSWRALVHDVFPSGAGNETSIVFGSDETAYCLLRDGPGWTAHLGSAPPPYENWVWNKLGMNVGGPKIMRLPDGRFMAGGRLYAGGARMSLCRVDVDKPDIREILRLPSGGDCSYPGMVARDDVLWVSYYSSHEGKTSIYLARLPLRVSGETAAAALEPLVKEHDVQKWAVAIEWLGMVGDEPVLPALAESALPALAEAACSISEYDREIARKALSRLSGEGIERAMLELAGNEEEMPEVRAGVIMALASRGKEYAARAFELAEQMLLDARMFGDGGLLPYVEEAYIEAAIALREVDPEKAGAALEYFIETSENDELIKRAAEAMR